MVMVCARWKRQETTPSFTCHSFGGREVQIAVGVGGLPVETDIQGAVVFAVEECVQEQ